MGYTIVSGNKPSSCSSPTSESCKSIYRNALTISKLYSKSHNAKKQVGGA